MSIKVIQPLESMTPACSPSGINTQNLDPYHDGGDDDHRRATRSIYDEDAHNSYICWKGKWRWPTVPAHKTSKDA